MKNKIKKIHFIGIGGSGMSGIAEVMKTLGFKVSGSDTANSDTIDSLKKLGIKIYSEHNKNNLKIHYYEDIFYGDSEKFLNEIGMDASLVDLRYLDSKYKYEEGNIFQNKELEKLIKSNQYTM